MHVAHVNILWAWNTGLVYLTSTITLSSTQACSCQHTDAYFEVISLETVPCRFGSLAPGCCPLMLLESDRENCVLRIKNFCLNIFPSGWKFTKLKTHKTWALYITCVFSQPGTRSIKCIALSFNTSHTIIFGRIVLQCSMHKRWVDKVCTCAACTSTYLESLINYTR